MRILVVNGPNLNRLGKRDPAQYGTTTLADIETAVSTRASELGTDVSFFQSNHEGAIIDFLQAESENADGIVINPGALTHYGLSLRDSLADTALPIIEVHLSNIHAREQFRSVSVIAPIAKGQIAGQGWKGYLSALDLLVDSLKKSG